VNGILIEKKSFYLHTLAGRIRLPVGISLFWGNHLLF